MRKHRRALRKICGQGMVEYIIIVALIALAAIAAFSYFGKTVRGQTVQMATQVAGESNDAGINAARTAASDARSNELNDVGLGDYHDRTIAP